MTSIANFHPLSRLKSFHPFRKPNRSPAEFRDFPLFFDFGADVEEPEIRLDVSENDAGYVVKAEMPGVKKEDIQVSLDGDQVSISAELKREWKEEKENKLIRSERYYGKQYRSFSLGQDIDEGNAQADYKDGLLTLHLPKKPDAQQRQKRLKIQ